LDDDLRRTLAEEARSRGIGLSAYLRQVAAEEARRIQRERIRQQSREIGAYVATTAAAREFYEDWGLPGSDGT